MKIVAKQHITYIISVKSNIMQEDILVKISTAGTISIPKQFRKYMDMQKGDYVKVAMVEDGLLVRKAVIS